MADNEKKLRIKQVKSLIGRPENQRRVVRSLGLHHIGDVVEHYDSPSIRGMVFKVKHLITVEEI